MKKLICLLLALAMVMTMFVACGKKEEEVSSVVEESSVVSEAGSSSAEEAGYPNASVPYQAVSINNIDSEEVQNYMKTMNLL